MTNSFSVGEAARVAGLTTHTLRWYEQVGLLMSRRTVGNQREFDESAVERVGLIRSLLAAGLSTSTIDDVLPCMSDPASQTPLLTRTLLSERARIDAEIARLTDMRQLLDGVIAKAPPETSASR